MKTLLLYLYAESPVHAGAPDTDGAVDLPIQRERATGYPVIWGQSLKGALRQTTLDRAADGLAAEMFGPSPGAANDADPRAGEVTVGDAQLIAMPVATLVNSFAWITSPLALGRLSRKYAHARRRLPSIPDTTEHGGLCMSSAWVNSQQVLGQYLVDVKKEPGSHLGEWANLLADNAIGNEPHMKPFATRFNKDLILVDDDVMRHVVRDATEIAVRVQLNEKRTVENGPFTSEYLPTESMLASVLTVRNNALAEQLMELFHDTILQIGGDQTLGKGLMWSRLVELEPTSEVKQ